MLSDQQFKTAKILYTIIALALFAAGFLLIIKGKESTNVYGTLMIVFAGLLFHDVRISKVERRLRESGGKNG